MTQTAKWFGCCPQCKSWNTLLESRENLKRIGKISLRGKPVEMRSLAEIANKSTQRMLSGIHEWDRVAGGGIVKGAFMILTGDPGVGKSTLLMQVANQLSKQYKLFYFSSEESLDQVKLRAERLLCLSDKMFFSDEADIDRIIATAEINKPVVLIVDSIQNCYNTESTTLPGSIGQLKESTFKLMRLAKEKNIAVILSGHITKDGAMAGPKTLEHIVDTVFYLQGEDKWQTRVLRTVKNRFGTTHELGFFQMKKTGLEEIPDVSKEFVDGITETPGSILVSYTEGSRPLILELQALTISSKYGIPQRVVTGIDQKQVVLIAAILEKYLKVKLNAQDIFFKVSGGLKIKGNSSDLAIALALLSSFFQKPIQKTLALGEISLTGQIKPTNHVDLHLKEAKKFGINRAFLSKNQKHKNFGCSIEKFAHVQDLIEIFR